MEKIKKAGNIAGLFLVIVCAVFAAVKISHIRKGYADTNIQKLRVCHLENPLGIDETPVFSWLMKSERRGSRQEAYRITVSLGKDALRRICMGQWENRGRRFSRDSLSRRSA